ncbi:hypothetical protein K466DRAFT_607811 [Polyporus arcularius HHB13444]|uniref:MACPF domain-containing protein n=1 Tax=Polyporus arcularius HHB13444 TaxID=1314778 RepID=A0A5C3NL30_9APHY|nr:hypothetical protein K466DRAFT_607811 [Polyporus arcularius HHB13444]
MTADGPQLSTRDLIKRPNNLNVNVDQTATMDSTTVEAEYTQMLMQDNYNSISVKVAAPFVTASVDYKKETNYKNTETQKTIMVSTRYLFPQGRVNFSPPGSGYANDLQLSDEFIEAIHKALAKPTKLAQREALYELFADFGDVFRSEVELGGTLSAHTMETFNRSENEETVKEEIKATLEATVAGWSAGVTAAHGNTETTMKTSSGRTLDVKYIVEGGDYTKIQETKEWVASTDNSDYWRVIEVSNAISVVDLLPDPIKTTTKALMRPLLGRWVDVERVPATNQYPVDIYRPKGAVPAGWFWLGHTADPSRGLIVKPSLPPKPTRNYAISTGHAATGRSNR